MYSPVIRWEMELDTTTLAKWLREAREARGFSQSELGEKANLSKGFISQLEQEANNVSGKPTIPKLETIVALANAVGQDVREPLKALGVLSKDESVNLSQDEQGVIELFRDLKPPGREAALELIEVVTRLEGGRVRRRSSQRRSVKGSRSRKEAS